MGTFEVQCGHERGVDNDSVAKWVIFCGDAGRQPYRQRKRVRLYMPMQISLDICVLNAILWIYFRTFFF